MNSVKPVCVPLAPILSFLQVDVLVQKKKMNICIEYRMLMQ
jgi:hypothetical protein